jgi:hypothetical protein
MPGKFCRSMALRLAHVIMSNFEITAFVVIVVVMVALAVIAFLYAE